MGANHTPTKDGRIGLTHALTPSGGVFSEFTVCRLAEDHILLTSAAAARRQDGGLLAAHAKAHAGVIVRDVTEEIGILAVMGPEARTLLQPLADHDLGSTAFPWLSVQTIQVAGIALTALRVSYAGELGWELHVPLDQMKPLYDALVAAGQPLDLAHFGAFALNAMRLEKGYRAWGLDLSTERTPLEAGLGYLVTPEARKALEREGAFSMKLLELEDGGADPFALHPVFAGARVAGLITSGAFGHRTGKTLALAYLKPEGLAQGASLTARILGREVPARVLAEAPYDPLNERLKA